jgi:hypothetical protein
LGLRQARRRAVSIGGQKTAWTKYEVFDGGDKGRSGGSSPPGE